MLLDIKKAKDWYSEKDPIHGYDHVWRVYHMAEKLAKSEGADLDIVLAAVLLHDAQGSSQITELERAEHHLLSAQFAKEVLEDEGWGNEQIESVQHCIRAHRFRSTELPMTIEAKVVFDADKLDVLGAFGAARAIAYAVLEGQPIYSEPTKKFLEIGEKELGEPHSSYHEFVFKLSKIKDRLFTVTGKQIAEKRHAYIVGFYAQMRLEIQGKV